MEPLQTGAKEEGRGIERGGRSCVAGGRLEGARSPGEVLRATVGTWTAGLLFGLVVLVGPAPGVLGNETRARGAVTSAPLELAPLMAQLAAEKGIRVPFRESRELAILQAPIVSEGVLFFAPPGELARITHSPGASRILVRGDQVVFDDPTGRTSFDLSSNEIARGFVEIFGVLLRGDLDELRRLFLLAFRADGETWTLEMRPRSRRLRALVERIEIQGHGTDLKRMTTFDTQGDRTSIAFGQAVPLSEIDPKEREEAFSLDSAGPLP